MQDSPFSFHCIHGPLAIVSVRLVLPPSVVELRAHNRDREALDARARLSSILHDCVESRRGRADEALMLAVEDEVSSSDEDLARA